jgi:UDP-N-acetylmuramate--alanine ligase
MNGAVMKNFVSEETPFASALVGEGDAFVSEVDESDGSIALYRPRIAVLNNVTLDHKSLDELRSLFGAFASRAETVVLNLDDEEARALGASLPPERRLTYSLSRAEADLIGAGLIHQPYGSEMQVTDRRTGDTCGVRLQVPGRHNAENALAAMGACLAAGLPLHIVSEAIGGFLGLRRRFELVGEANGVAVIDDFGHNPDKIAATLRTLHAFPGRLLLFFQPHGYGPLRSMGRELSETFVAEMSPDDVLVMPDPVYHGGTTDMSVGSGVVIDGVRAGGRQAEHIAQRTAGADRLVELARPGDRIVVMGARDDTLSVFAAELVERLR